MHKMIITDKGELINTSKIIKISKMISLDEGGSTATVGIGAILDNGERIVLKEKVPADRVKNIINQIALGLSEGNIVWTAHIE